MTAKPDEIMILRAMMEKADRIHVEYQRRQAILIGNEIAKVLKAAFKK